MEIYMLTPFISQHKSGGRSKYIRIIYDLFPDINFVEIYDEKTRMDAISQKLSKINVIYKKTDSIYEHINTLNNKNILFHTSYEPNVLKKLNINTLKNNNVLFVDHGGSIETSFIRKDLNKQQIYKKRKAIKKIYRKNKKVTRLLNLVTYTKYDKEKFKYLYRGIIYTCPLSNDISVKVRDKYRNFNERKYDIVFIGRLAKQKNIDLLNEIFIELVSRKPNIKICVVGNGREKIYKHKNIEHIENLSNSNSSGIYDILNDSKYFIFVSKWEGFGYVLVEAMSQSTPLLLLNTFEAAKFVINADEKVENQNGLLFNNKDELIDWYVDNAKNNEIWEILSKNSLDFSQKELNINKFKSNWDKIFNEMFN